MSSTTSGQTRKRRTWPLVLLVATIIMLIPATREFVLTWIGYAIAILAGIFITALMMLGKPPPRR